MSAAPNELFSEKLLDHFRHPRNAGELYNATHSVEVSNPVCGDVLRLAVRLEQNVLAEIRFLCRGCTASIACASLLTEKLHRANLQSISSITAEQLAAELALTPSTLHAAHLAADAFAALQRRLAADAAR